MIHIAFDTSGIGKNRSLSHANYKALQRLVLLRKVTIHIPYIVKREIETQQIEYYLEDYRILKKSISDFLKTPKSNEIKAKFNDIKNIINEAKESVEIDAEQFSKQWVEGLNATIYEIDAEETKNAFEAYFSGTAPLTTAKNRLDIPDSFICRSFEKIKTNVNHLIVVVSDKKVINTFKEDPNYTVIDGFTNLINNELIQPILRSLDSIDIAHIGLSRIDSQLGDLLGFINRYEKSNTLLNSFLSSKIEDALSHKNVYEVPYSNNYNGEATISSSYEGRNVQIDLDSPIYYGDDQIGFPFELEVEANIEYFIDKSEYWMMKADERNDDIGISVSDWNDHVFEAEEIVDLKVKGIVSVRIAIASLDSEEIAELETEELDDYFNDVYVQAEFKIESIDEIDLN